MPTELGPLRFQRHFLEKVWGGRALERRPGFSLPDDVPIGETWEVVDRAKENSVVAEGGPEGVTLRELMESHGDDLLGKAPSTPDGRFPLLVKYLDASDNLSVQVHPDEAMAAQIGGGAEAKTEAWYVVDCEPGGVLYAGLKPEVTAEEFGRVADSPGVLDLLNRWEVRPGDCMLVPGGTVHAIGKGVTILEVQQNSDTTYRIWDWGRMGLDGTPRETHVPQALRSTAFGAPPRGPVRPVWLEEGTVKKAPLARSNFFGMNALRVRGESRLSTGGQFQMYAVVGGRGSLRTKDSPRRMLSAGDVWLVPAACGYHWVAPEDDDELELVQLLYRA